MEVKMKLSAKKIASFIVLAAIGLVVWLLFFSMAGCEVFKFRKQSKEDSAAVKKATIISTDSTNGGSVKKETINVKEFFDWWKVTQQFQPKSGDTTINNFYPQPATIIYEGGRGTREESKSSIDSNYYTNIMKMMMATFDSTNRRLDTIEKTKHSETKGLGVITLVLLGVCLLIANKLLGFVGNNYSISKKIKS